MTEIEIEFLNQENERLKSEVNELKEKQKTIHTEYKKQISDLRKDRLLALLIGSKKTKFDDLPPSVKDSIFKDILTDRLSADGAELSVSDGGQLILRKKDGTTFFGEDHRLLTPDAYIDRLLTLEKIGDDPTPAGQPDPAKRMDQPAKPAGSNNNGSGQRKTAISTLVNEALQGFSAEPII